MQCPSCGAELTEILAKHEYSIELNSETGQWGRGEGDVIYTCGNCSEELGFHDIEDILKQVDEL